jgi:very-short-patch-repair endonuclease
MRHPDDTADEILARIATSQHGLVTRPRALGASVTPAELRHRMHVGALLVEYPGVYRVGHRAPSLESRYLAAVLACGAGAALSGPAAGYLLGLLAGPPPPPDVTALTRRRVAGVLTHRTRSWHSADRVTWRGVPVTSAARTLVDLAAVLEPQLLAKAAHEASVRHRTTPELVESALSRRPNSAGAAVLRRVLRGDERVSLSVLERRFVSLLTQQRLPLPKTNHAVGTRRVDCLWPVQMLVVELDGYRYHGSRYAWEQDRHREREARASGFEFRRYTYGDVVEDPRLMLAELVALLRPSVAA